MKKLLLTIILRIMEKRRDYLFMKRIRNTPEGSKYIDYSIKVYNFAIKHKLDGYES